MGATEEPDFMVGSVEGDEFTAGVNEGAGLE